MSNGSKLRLRWTLEGHVERIGKLAWSPDGSVLATPSDDGTVRIWTHDTGECVQVLRHPADPSSKGNYEWNRSAGSVAWSPQGDRLVVGCLDGNAYIRTLAKTERTKPVILPGHRSGSFLNVTWSPAGDVIASGGTDGMIRLWKSDTGTQVSSFEFPMGLTDVSFSPAGLAASTADGHLHAYMNEPARHIAYRLPSQLPSIGLESNVLANLPVIISALASSRRVDRIAAATLDGSICLWDVDRDSTDVLVHDEFLGLWTGGLSFSADDRFLAAKSTSGGMVRIWDLTTREPWAQFEEPGERRRDLASWADGIAFHPTLPVLASLGQGDRGVRIWDVAE